jgi:DNA-binding transcriptional LysR family regulator
MNKLEDMQTFIRIVEAGSITKAAAQLNTVKSAISKRLTNLEHSLGITLLNRTTRSQTLTDNGTIYYQRCLQIVDDVNELESSLKNDLCALSGTIRIAAPLSFGLTHLSKALTQFNAIQTQIKFDIDFNDRKIDIINEGFDLAIRIGKLEDSSLMAKKITTAQTHLLASQSYLDTHGIPKSPQELSKNHVNLQYSNAPNSINFRDKNNKPIAVNIPSALISNNGDYLCQAAINGQGLLSTPDFICYKHVKSGQLIPIMQESYIPTIIGVYAIYPPTRQLSRRVRSLVDYLVQFFGEKPYWSL